MTSYIQTNRVTSSSNLVLDATSGSVVQLSKTLDFNSNSLINGTTASFGTSVTTPAINASASSDLTLTASGKNVVISGSNLNINSVPIINALSLTAVAGSDFTITAASGKSIKLGTTSPLNINGNSISGATSITANTGSDLTLAGDTGKSVISNSTLNMNTNAISGVTTLGVTGLISSPSGVTFTKQVANPGGATTIYIDNATGHLFVGSTDLQQTISLQSAYNNSTSPQIVLTSGLGGLVVADNATPINATLFNVSNNSGATSYFKVNATTSTFGTDVIINGNLAVNGTTTSINTTNTAITDNFLYLNDGYTGTGGSYTGLSVNYKATATATTIGSGVSFTVGVNAVSNPSVTTVGSNIFSAGDLIQIYNTQKNNGIYEVLTHVGTTLTIKGIGLTSTVESFSNTNFVSETTTAIATVTKVNISALRSDFNTGLWQVGIGSNTGAGLTYNFMPIAPTSTTSTAIAVYNGTNGSALSNTGVLIDGSNNVTGANTLTVSKSSQTTTGTFVSEFKTTTASNGTITKDTIQNAIQTTDATVTTINSFTIANNTLFGIETIILGRNSTTADQVSFTLRALFKVGGTGTVTQVGSTISNAFLDSTPASAGWTTTLTASGANTLLLTVTGANATTIRWHSTSEIYYYTY